MNLIQKAVCEKYVIGAIDADNLIMSSAKKGPGFKEYHSIMIGFERMFNWMESFAKILRIDVYLPPSRCIDNPMWNNLWEKCRKEFFLNYVYCPKKKPKSLWEKKDNVDAHLIEKTEEIAKNYNGKFHYFCLASGDRDYSPLLWQLKREADVEIAFAIGSESSFSKTYRQTGIVARHPINNEELVHYFSTRKDI
ncbi:MAG: NYN domain-containing protein [Candidatus Staskawiczbacteria bacterium]|nr:NYN domain-containing protein [Candidatus Staskawiczbacteria bacterium]MBI3337613.1 NYN domain-containing protein [Candidatus Staskawiczbacteria bacterium]